MEVRSFKDAYEWNPPMLWFCSIFSTFILLLFATGDVQLSLYLFLSLSLLSVLAFMVSVLIIVTTKWFKHQKKSGRGVIVPGRTASFVASSFAFLPNP